MGEKKEIKVSLGAVICMFIIFILIIALVGMWYYYNYVKTVDNNIQQKNTIETTKNIILLENTINSNNTTSNEDSTESADKYEYVPSSDEEIVEAIATAFIKAVNEKDWKTVEDYSNAQIVSDIRKYDVSNMSIDFNTLEKNTTNDSWEGYYYKCSYDINYDNLTKSDLGMGGFFCIEKINGQFSVTTFCATGI